MLGRGGGKSGVDAARLESGMVFRNRTVSVCGSERKVSGCSEIQGLRKQHVRKCHALDRNEN